MRLLPLLAVAAFMGIAGTASPAAAADISAAAAKGLPHVDPCVHKPKHGHLFFHKLFKSKCYLPSEARGGNNPPKVVTPPKYEDPKCERHCGPKGKKGKKFGKGKWGDGPGKVFKKKRGKEAWNPPSKPKKQRGFRSGGKKGPAIFGDSKQKKGPAVYGGSKKKQGPAVFGGSKQKKGSSARGGSRDKSPPTYATSQKKKSGGTYGGGSKKGGRR